MTFHAAGSVSKPRSLWRHPNYLKLWSAATVTGLGDQVTALALPLVAIAGLQATAFEVALLGTVQFLPFVLLSLQAGVVVDRLPKRAVLIASDLGRAILLGTIPAAFLLGFLSMAQLYVVGFLAGCLRVLFDVAHQSYLPALVARDRLVEGNAKLELSRAGAQVAGPGLGGVLVAAITAPVAIIVDALSFVASAFLVALIPHDSGGSAVSPSNAGSMRTQIWAGLRFVLTHPYLKWIAASTALLNLFGYVAFGIMLVYFVRELGLAPEAIGVVAAIGNLGALATAAIASRIGGVIGVGPAIVGSAALAGPALILLAIAPPEWAVFFAAASVLLGGISAIVYNVNQVSLRQAITPDEMRGRMNATMRFIVWGTIPIGSLVGGAIATMFGMREAMWVAAVGVSTSFLPVLLSGVRRVREIGAAPGHDQSK